MSHHEADLPAIAKVLEHYELAAPNLTLAPLARDEVEESFAQKRIDALGFIAAPASAEAGGLMSVVAKVSGGKVAVVGVDEAEALAQKRPALSTFTIAPGSLGGRPKTPEEDVKTLAVSYRLMARMDADRVVIAKVAQHLFQLRPRVAQTEPAIDLMKAPETETSTSAALPNHQGAIDYDFREQRSFMDRYGDWILDRALRRRRPQPAFAWIGQLFARKRRELVDQVLDRGAPHPVGGARREDGRRGRRPRHGDRRPRHPCGAPRPQAHHRHEDHGADAGDRFRRAAIADRRRDILDDAAAPSTPRLAPYPDPAPAETSIAVASGPRFLTLSRLRQAQHNFAASRPRRSPTGFRKPGCYPDGRLRFTG